MYLLQRIMLVIRGRFMREQPASLTLDEKTLLALQQFAAQEQRTAEEVATKILGDALRNHMAQDENWQLWLSLTPREQEITALICLNYTSRQIAARLHISTETVKTHAEHILMKFGASDRQTIRMMLNGWNFSAWDQ
jgi:DNA-binding CsgD family transcriptional regulator